MKYRPLVILLEYILRTLKVIFKEQYNVFCPSKRDWSEQFKERKEFTNYCQSFQVFNTNLNRHLNIPFVFATSYN